MPDNEGAKYDNFIICTTTEPEDGTPVLPAVSIYIKRNAIVEYDRDIESDVNVIVANEHYGVSLTNESKVVKVTFKA